ncbi:hypothetical protein [Rhodococcus globerulus]|uniref:hypothetical protein n=1 Tax=Rhodococcus globerulus TaxID=33008 RepID=UPI003017A406
MTRQPFEPIGDTSRRRAALELLSAADYGQVVAYDDLSEAMGGVERATIQQAVNKAKAALEAEHSKAVVAVPNTGYRVVEPGEHLALATTHQRKSRRSLSRGHSIVAHVDANALTEGERAAVILAASALAAQIDYMRRNDMRARRIEQSVEAVQQETTRSADEIAELRARLDRLEGK